MPGFLPFIVGNDFKYSCSIHGGLLSVHCLTGTNEVYTEKTGRFLLQLNAGQKKILLLHVSMLKMLRTLASAESAGLR